jgi:Nucleotidyltransferase domain
MSQKREHSLHTSLNTEDFLRKFEIECGCTLHSCVSAMVSMDQLSGVVLGGSIPLGIGTSASDVDVLVLVDSHRALISDSPNCSAAGLFSGTFIGDSSELAITNVVSLLNGVEVDFTFMLAPRVLAIHERLERGSLSLTVHQIRLLSRIKTGWLLIDRDQMPRSTCKWGVDNALEVHCAVRYFIFGLKDREDAHAALADNVPLAYHLGRSCVERCFESYLSSRGYAYVGNKWLRFLAQLIDHQNSDAESLRTLGVPLLFPSQYSSRGKAEDYLESVDAFMVSVRSVLEKDLGVRIALRLCPQVNVIGKSLKET